jgi:hypothetical protein
MRAVRRGCTECTDRFDSGAERSTCILTSGTQSIRASRMAGTQPPPDPERHRGAEGACTRPVSRVLSSVAARTVIPLGVRSPAPSSSLPAASRSRWASSRRLFGLAPAGVYPAVRVTTNTVGSYPTFSPLPVLAYGRFVFCGTVRRGGPHVDATPRSYLAACPWSPDFPRRRLAATIATVRPSAYALVI